MSTRKLESVKKPTIIDKIYETFPLFWRKCRICRREKRFEWMWRYDNYITDPFTMRCVTEKLYFCKQCSLSIKAAKGWIGKWRKQ